MRRLFMMFIIVTVLAAVSASASLLDVDGAVIQVFEPELPLLVPGEGNATIRITPQSLNAGSNGEALEAQITLKEGCSQEDIVFGSITLRVVGQSGSVSPEREISRNKTKLIVSFDRQQVLNLIGNHQGDDVTLEVSGHDSWGCQFTGYDTIKFKQSSNVPTGGGDDSTTTDSDGSGDTNEPTTDTDGATDDDGASEPTTDEGSDTEQSGGEDSGSESSSEGDGGGSESSSEGGGSSDSSGGGSGGGGDSGSSGGP